MSVLVVLPLICVGTSRERSSSFCILRTKYVFPFVPVLVSLSPLRGGGNLVRLIPLFGSLFFTGTLCPFRSGLLNGARPLSLGRGQSRAQCPSCPYSLHLSFDLSLTLGPWICSSACARSFVSLLHSAMFAVPYPLLRFLLSLTCAAAGHFPSSNRFLYSSLHFFSTDCTSSSSFTSSWWVSSYGLYRVSRSLLSRFFFNPLSS